MAAARKPSVVDVQPDETAGDVFARLRCSAFECGIRAIDAVAKGGLRGGDILEISGLSGSGKTALLCTAAAKLATEGLRGGPSMRVYYLDLNGRVALHTIVANIELNLEPLGEASNAEVRSQCLRRILVAYCASILELSASLARIRAEISALPSGELVAIIIDGLGANFWVDKLELNAGTYDRITSQLLDLSKTRRVVSFVAITVLFEHQREGVAPLLSRHARVRAQLVGNSCAKQWQLRASASAAQPGAGGTGIMVSGISNLTFREPSVAICEELLP